MLGIQILIILFAIFAVVRTLSQLRRQKTSRVAAAGWSLFWIAAIVVVLRPETTQWLATRLGVGRGADVVIYFSLAALFFLVFRLFVKLEEVEREISRLVRSIALNKKDL